MASILQRYVFRETLGTWVAVTGVLMAILITNQFAAVLGEAAASKLPRGAILELLALTSIQYLTILIPVGLFLAIMLGMARLYHDSEMAAMMACGVGPARLYRALAGFALSLAVVVGILALVVGPAALRQIEDFADEAKREASLGLLEPGRFVTFGNGEATLYAESRTPDNHLHRVFVQRQLDDRIEIIVADEAWQSEVNPGLRVLTFARGNRYEGRPGQPEFRIVAFAEHGIPIVLPDVGGPSRKAQSRTARELIASQAPADRAELHWRIGVPLTLLILAILAVPLSRTEPRQGRFSGLASAILVYLIYANLLAAGKGWIEREQLPGFLGLWWVHALFLSAAGVLLFRHQGGWRRWRQRRRALRAAS
ncbi:MAG: LPS export ABC transporter permease LptF [Gammaproteobacteria bacterium]|nr:LPS export ABC transporter permease LptF [Gammaproteobacteria bacterium]